MVKYMYMFNLINHAAFSCIKHSLGMLSTAEGLFGGGGGGGGLNREAPPQGPTLYPFIYHFGRKGTPCYIPFFTKWYPFHIPTGCHFHVDTAVRHV